ncbi:hypothetical protein KEM52_003251 [Ascosphaera acerosa]|nr:hypothetical protein KEM52_003251 [Ascosphaera acerosa]
MESPTERAAWLYSLQHWLQDDQLWSDSDRCDELHLNPEAELPLITIAPTKTQLDQLLTVIRAWSLDGTESSTDSGSAVLSTAAASQSAEHHESESTASERSADLLQIKKLYNPDVKEWPVEAERLMDTHMTPAEQARGHHYGTQYTHNLAQRKQIITEHRQHVATVRAANRSMEQLVEQDETYRLDANRAAEDMAGLCAMARSRAPLRGASTSIPRPPSAGLLKRTPNTRPTSRASRPGHRRRRF